MNSREKVLETAIERGRKRCLMIKSYHFYLLSIRRACEKVFDSCEVCVFGSVLTGKFTLESDVDLLIKVPNPPKSLQERAKVEAKIEELAGLPDYHPFKFHIVDEEGFKWYVEKLKRVM
ncbi:TPA: nucleotidyltransferase [Pyrococcus horikoshii]|uniref:Nucleotidyltransferase n=2 Tax=Pyrococcus horikoshii TaxID=53953 RepID=A0A832W7Z4_PYRHR|nr:nucleotidyltransferase domain-containing protein [Pyrococcus horikoshii]HII61353.1 nucleotidyltransferase [Pyrococcus horikoshii]